MKKILLFLTILVGSFNSPKAQNTDSIVKHAANNFMASGTRVGFSIGVIKKDSTYTYNFGTVQKGKSDTPTEKTIYEIGSITKTFTSLLLANAVVENRVALSDDIRKYLHGAYPNLQFNGKPIRLLHLVNLTSGLPNNLPEKMPEMKPLDHDSLLLAIQDFHNSYSTAQFLTDLQKVKLTGEPGLKPAHSNTAGELLGFLLENIYGEKYDVLLRKYITGPLKMGSTFTDLPVSKKPLYAPGYNDKGVLMPGISKDAGSAGVLKSSLTDMISYMKYQLREKDKAIIMSHTPMWGDPENYAFGLNWSIKTNFDGQTKIWTTGGTFGFSCYLCIYPGRNYGIVILTNENDNRVEDRLSGMAQTIYNELYFTATQRASEGFGYSSSINTLLDALNKYGFENSVKVVSDLKQKEHSFKLTEDELNTWGYSFLSKAQKTKALEIFKLNVYLFPTSTNTYDSLAETYETMGDILSSIKNYQLELALDPQNKRVADHLKKLAERSR